MEKIVAALWAPETQSQAAFNATLLERLPGTLRAAGASHIRANIHVSVHVNGRPVVRIHTRTLPT